MQTESNNRANVLAIDFGTSRIKAAYWNPTTHRAEVIAIGQDEKRYIPTLFHVDKTGVLSYGDSAADLLVHDPSGSLDDVKLHLDKLHRTPNGQTKESHQLLTPVFARIVKTFREHYATATDPIRVVYTVPARWDYADLYNNALQRADQSVDSLAFIKEPEAAAFHWLSTEGRDFTGRLVVVDIGGGTVDWACIDSIAPRPEFVVACPPSGIEGAGLEVDRLLLNWLDSKVRRLDDEQIRERLSLYFRDHKPQLLDYVRKAKERSEAADGRDFALVVAGHRLEIEAAAFDFLFNSREIQRIVNETCRYITKAATPERGLTCLLTGGTSRQPALGRHLTAAVRDLEANHAIAVSVEISRNPNYATVLGAVEHYVRSQGLNRPTKPSTRAGKEKNDTGGHRLTEGFFDPNKI